MNETHFHTLIRVMLELEGVKGGKVETWILDA